MLIFNFEFIWLNSLYSLTLLNKNFSKRKFLTLLLLEMPLIICNLSFGGVEITASSKILFFGILLNTSKLSCFFF